MQTHNPKTVLVTGASSGFGHHIAQTLALSGYRVFGTSRSTRPDFGPADNPVRMLQLDITDDQSVQHCIEQTLAEATTLDVLVNNAGNGLAGALEDCGIDEAHWQMDTNFFGPLRMIRQVTPIMRQQSRGRIITIGSMAGHAALPYQGVYSASKHALEAINEALRLELSGSNVDATIVCPGDFNTGFTAARTRSRNAPGPAHASQFESTMAIYERDERNGAPAEQVALLVKQLVEAKSLRVRYFTGRLDQRFGMHLKRWLPANVFERLMRSIYNIP